MSTPLALFLVLIALILGAVLGWLAQAYRASNAGQSPSAQESLASAEQQAQLHQAQLNQSLAPMEHAVAQLSQQLGLLEKERASGFASLNSQLQSMVRTSSRLSERTNNLVTALRSPNVRGRWGEVQLERVVELAGMTKHVDFDPQLTGRHGSVTVRPDLVVHLAGQRSIIVDAKAPLSSYLDALDTQDPEEHQAYLRRHANLLRSHVNALAGKDYIEAFAPTPEFVVLFVPAEPFLDAALSVDPELLEYAFGRNIVIATPSSLIALLRTVALGWRQEDISDTARQVQRLGSELYTRLNTMGEHYNSVGRSLEKAVSAYNSTLSSMDSRVMVTARRLQEMEVPTRSDRKPTHLHAVGEWPRRT